MTATAGLERIARGVIPPVGATGWRITVLETRPATVYAVVPVIGGRVDGRPVFSGAQRDAHTMYRLLAGEHPTPRPAQAEPTSILEGLPALTSDPEQPEAPELAPAPHQGSIPASEPFPEGGARRLTSGHDSG